MKSKGGEDMRISKWRLFLYTTIVLLLIPIIANWLISWHSSYTVLISNKNQEIWLSFYATWFSGIIGSIIGGVIAYQLAKMQLDSNRENQTRLLKQEEKRKIIINTYESYKTLKQNILQTIIDIRNDCINIAEDINKCNIYFDPNKFNKQLNKFNKRLNECDVEINRNLYIYSEYENTKTTNEIRIDNMAKAHCEIILAWKKVNNSYADAIMKNGVITHEAIFDYFNEFVIPKINKLKGDLNEYEYGFLTLYLSDIINIYTCKSIIVQEIKPDNNLENLRTDVIY